MFQASDDSKHPLAQRFTQFVSDRAFPCVGAKSALNKGGMRFVVARDFGSAWDDLRILPNLLAIGREHREDPAPFRSLVVMFEHGAPRDEAGFEAQLWARLQSLSDKDAWLGQPIDPRISTNPEDPHFALSFGGEGFFVVGLHPSASRPGRRFDTPAMVFNLHGQFEQLREAGRYQPLREAIIARDVALAGTVNPMLAEHGHGSAARQYSGRVVDEAWRCPFAGRDVSDAA